MAYIYVSYVCCVVATHCFFCLLACLEDFSGGILWPTNRRNLEVSKSCSGLHRSFRARANVIRKCNDDGSWGPTDDSSCTALNDAIPTLIVSFKVNVSGSTTEAVADNVSLDVLIATYYW